MCVSKAAGCNCQSLHRLLTKESMVSRPSLVPTENGLSRFIGVQTIFLHIAQLCICLFYHNNNKGIDPVNCHLSPTKYGNDNEACHTNSLSVEWNASSAPYEKFTLHYE